MAASAGQALASIHRAGRTWAVVALAAGVLVAGGLSGSSHARATSLRNAPRALHHHVVSRPGARR
jgi:hypothetical protein